MKWIQTFAFVQISRILSVLVLPHGVMTPAGVSWSVIVAGKKKANAGEKH